MAKTKSKNTESYKGIYGMHKYWGKKPFNVVSEFIERYSKEGDVVLDSFCGSGVTIIEAVKLNRRAVGIDLNPIAIKLTKASIKTVDEDKITKAFNEIKTELQPKINSLYETRCNDCGSIGTQTHLIWSNGEPIEAWYKCDVCRKKKIVSKPTIRDKELSAKPKIEPLWFPTTVLFKNSRINVHEGQRVSDLFTKRALVSLSYIKDRINKIADDDTRDIMELTFSGAISQASKLVFVIRRRNKNSTEENGGSGKPEVGSWVVGYWVPKEHFEINAWNCFENRFNRVLRGVKEVNSLFAYDLFIESTNIYDSFDDLNEAETGAMIANRSAVDTLLPDNSVSYVFIDPPHGNRILYMEMSLMWNSWLGLDNVCSWNEEIVVSEAKERKKETAQYAEMMNDAVAEIKRVLIPNKYFSLAFNSLDDDEWLSMLNLCVRNGFLLTDIRPLDYSATSVVQDNRNNALKTDFVITYLNSNEMNHKEIGLNLDELKLRDAIRELLSSKDLETYDIINQLFSLTIPEGYIYPPSKIVSMLKKEFIRSDGKWQL